MTATLSSTEQRRAGLLVVAKRRATGLLVVAAVVFVVSAVLVQPGPWLEWVAGRRHRLAGRRAGGLVRGHRPVPPPARPADPAHRHRGGAQGPVSPRPSGVCPGELPHARRGERAAARPRTPSSGWRPGWPTPTTPPALAARLADGLVAGTDLLRDEDVHRVLDAAGPRPDRQGGPGPAGRPGPPAGDQGGPAPTAHRRRPWAR